MAKYNSFDSPGNNPDFGGDANLAAAWSSHMSFVFKTSIESVSAYLAQHGGGTCQFYNPVTDGRDAPDLPAAAADIPWNGFPKRHGSPGPGQPVQFAAAEQSISAGDYRDQDEYLEWFVERQGGKITAIHFTCEAYDYFEFLAKHAPDTLLALYKKYVSPAVTLGDLFPQGPHGGYDTLNKWNTEAGAMHLTHPANNLFAEVFLAATASVRRSRHGVEITQSIPLIQCSGYGDDSRNSDPAIGSAVNGLCREGRHVTLADPVGLYMASFAGAGLTLNGQPAGGYFKLQRGAFPLGLRAIYELPAELKAQGLTVSDVKTGATPVTYGGQLAERISMHIAGRASVAQDLHNVPVPTCGQVPQVNIPEDAEAKPFAAGHVLNARAQAGA